MPNHAPEKEVLASILKGLTGPWICRQQNSSSKLPGFLLQFVLSGITFHPVKPFWTWDFGLWAQEDTIFSVS